MKYILAISLLFLAACKDEDRKDAEKKRLKELCESEFEYDSLKGNWRKNYKAFNGMMPHTLRLRFRPEAEEVLIQYSCNNGYGQSSERIKREVGFYDEDGELEIGGTGSMEPRGNGFRCQKLNFGGKFSYEFSGKCLLLNDGNGQMAFVKGL